MRQQEKTLEPKVKLTQIFRAAQEIDRGIESAEVEEALLTQHS